MQNKQSVIAIFEAIIGKSSDPFIKSMEGLPVNVLDSLLTDLVHRSEIQCGQETLAIKFDIKAFKRRVKGAFQHEVLGDEVGVLIQFGASKNVITEVTGVHQTVVKSSVTTQSRADPGNWTMDKSDLLKIAGISYRQQCGKAGAHSSFY